MDNFKNRLKLAIEGKSVNAFAKKSGITEGTLRTYLSGASLPGLDKIIAISNAAEVNIEWLATGNGPIRNRIDIPYETCLGAESVDVREVIKMEMEVHPDKGQKIMRFEVEAEALCPSCGRRIMISLKKDI
jgi:transcriptional regulator with XRE-family HTH domain